MNKNIIWAMGALTTLALSSCNDFLDRKPLDFGDESAYFKTANDLRLSTNEFYTYLPADGTGAWGMYTEDNESDNQVTKGANSLFYKGDKRTPAQGSSEWKFTNLRAINYFINKTNEKIAAGQLDGNNEFVRHYLGEGYFFRAYDYFRLLTNYGDVPILTQMLPDDPNVLAANSLRQPRNMVARFIIANLDTALTMLKQQAPEAGRISKDAAFVLKSRVALYEGTWERYHAGTCFVPGNKWVGKEAHPGFTYNADEEINYFLDEAIKAADSVASTRKLNADYAAMFNNTGTFANDDEVILARYYKTGTLSHSTSYYLSRNGGGTGITRALVNTYLTENGLPIYAEGNTQYKGDRQVFDELENRDHRLTESVRGAGLVTTTNNGEIDTLKFFLPSVDVGGADGVSTGYNIKKWVSTDPAQNNYTSTTTATPIFRAAEAYLNYIEAYYERHHSLDAKATTYWQALRRRAGVNTDINATINATDLTQENDLGVYSHGQMVDKTLYNIRRERRCEFIAEGMRLNDLKRWRSLDNMVNYQPEGMNMWEYMYTLYAPDRLSADKMTQSGISNYLHPLQISSNGAAYDGYTFPKQHYLEPIPISEFLLTKDAGGKQYLYQNPGWPTNADGTADYNYDCD